MFVRLFMDDDISNDEESACKSIVLSSVSEAFSPDTAPLSLVSPLYARYEFVKRLGKGAFGSVSLMRSRLDRRLEAVKSVAFASPHPPWAHPDVMARSHDPLLREVRALAACQDSRYVVRYYSSWIEPDWARLRSRLVSSSKSQNETGGYGEEEEEEASSYPSRQNFLFDDDSSIQTLAGIEKETADDTSWPYVLNIALQPASGVTLQAWLQRRNDNYSESMSSSVFGKVEQSIFKQIVLALIDVHSRGLIHRDLKPANVFVEQIVEETDIMIGVTLVDFGLTTLTHIIDDTSTISSYKPPTDSCLVLRNPFRTRGVGTPSYCAPEQVTGTTYYGPEVDLYPLGLILVELATVFRTQMERIETLLALREDPYYRGGGDAIPESMERGCPEAAGLARRLLSHDPARRPCLRSITI